MYTNLRVMAALRNAIVGCTLALLLSCNSDNNPPADFVTGAPATNGVFDAALTQDDSGGLWMSYSVVNVSSNDPALPRVDTRIASSSNAGSNWTDTGVAPYIPPAEFQVPYQGGQRWAAWQYEVSRLVYDSYATDPNLRWKRFWHRYLRAKLSGECVNSNGINDCLFENGWIGVATAPAPTGPWSPERKLLVGTLYNTGNDVTIGPPEYTPTTLAPGGQLNGCPIFTEPGALATANGIYISLKCAGGSADKVVLLRCGNNLAAASCTYIVGNPNSDFLANSEAAQFTPPGQTSYDGFSATELVTVNGVHYLIVTPTVANAYRGCLVFQIDDLTTAALVRGVNNNPVLLRTITGTPGSFNGACGYTPAASSSGVIYSELQGSVPQFRLFRSGVTLP